MADSIQLFGVRIDCVSMTRAVEQIYRWVEAPVGKCQYVVTPNVDHTVILETSSALREAYANASLVLVDGWPVQWAARWLKGVIPPRVPGSDLTPALFAAAETKGPLKVFLLGAAPGVAKRAAKKIHNRYENVDVVGYYSPPIGFEKDDQENERILMLIRESAPDVLVLGLGAPKQELWAHRHQDRIAAKAALCVGATIDFLAGEKKRAPKWIQALGLEWAHRMCSEPKRLVKRYARDAVIFPRLVLKEMWAGAGKPQQSAART